MKRARSRWFVLSGAAGGLAGFLLVEATTQGSMLSAHPHVLRMAWTFTAFGLAVGAALGMTEGLVRREWGRLAFGLGVGAVLGALGGFVGGAAGQTLFGLLPQKYSVASQADVAIALDSSGSMRSLLFFGSDPHGRRREAAKRLVERLAPSDRVAVVDFDEVGQLALPLTRLDSDAERRAAFEAIDRIDDVGGTHLDAGLLVALDELAARREEDRPQHLIFLTDGQGTYVSDAGGRARREQVTIHTIGLGGDVDAALLSRIAAETGGRYYPVGDADALIGTFDRIFEESLDMASYAGGRADARLETSSVLRVILRGVSWGVLGLLIGFGQGVRENTREDVRACSLGGFAGGAFGGLLFDPVSSLAGFGGGLVGRAVAEIVVGASIGGSMRLLQRRMVDLAARPPTTLTVLLPKNRLVVEGPGRTGVGAVVAGGSLADYQRRYPDRGEAMVLAHREGGFAIEEVARQFGVTPSRVISALRQR
jgi:hypothetical protein